MRAENVRLRAENANLREHENANLRAENVRLRAENVRLRATNANLREHTATQADVQRDMRETIDRLRLEAAAIALALENLEALAELALKQRP